MAVLELTDITTIGSTANHTGTNWKVTYDEAGTDILMEINNSPELTVIRDPLIMDNGEYYDGSFKVWGFAQLVFRNGNTSPWYMLNCCQDNNDLVCEEEEDNENNEGE